MNEDLQEALKMLQDLRVEMEGNLEMLKAITEKFPV